MDAPTTSSHAPVFVTRSGRPRRVVQVAGALVALLALAHLALVVVVVGGDASLPFVRLPGGEADAGPPAGDDPDATRTVAADRPGPQSPGRTAAPVEPAGLAAPDRAVATPTPTVAAPATTAPPSPPSTAPPTTTGPPATTPPSPPGPPASDPPGRTVAAATPAATRPTPGGGPAPGT